MIYFDGIIYSWQKGGGVYRYFQKLISFVADKGVESTLLLQKPFYGVPHEQSKSLRFKNTGTSLIPRKLASPLNKILIERYFRSVSEGVFHSTYYTTYDNLHIPQVVTVHDMTHERFPEFYDNAGARRFIKRKKLCIDRADVIICVSHATKAALLETYDVPETKISVVHHGVDDFFNTEYDKKTMEKLSSTKGLTQPFVLFVGNRSHYKNFDFFARAFASWGKRDDFHVAVTGGGEFTSVELALLTKLGIASQVRHVGYVSEEELKALYCTCEAFVFPSLDEGFGLPILEAICCGARVIASDIATFREIGFDIPVFFNPENPVSLLAALDEAITPAAKTPEERDKDSQLIRTSFSWKTSLEALIAVYEKLGGRGASTESL